MSCSSRTGRTLAFVPQEDNQGYIDVQSPVFAARFRFVLWTLLPSRQQYESSYLSLTGRTSHLLGQRSLQNGGLRQMERFCPEANDTRSRY